MDSSFTQNDYEIVARDICHDGFFRMVRYHVRYRLFNGDWSPITTLEVMERKSAVGVLAYDPLLDVIVLIEQFRPGALANPRSPWLLEIIAGVFNPDEKPEEVARREAKEEANCEILDLIPISTYFVSPGGSNEEITLFCARIDATHVGGIHGLHSEHEDIRAFTVPVDDALIMVQENKIKTAPAIVALHWLQLNRERLRELWLKK